MSHLLQTCFPYPRTQKYEREVECIMHLNQLAYRLPERLPNSFNNVVNVTNLHNSIANSHAHLVKHGV